MKVRYKEHENKYYLDFLNEGLYLIVTRTNGNETILKIQGKLKGKDLEIFNNIVFYFTAINIVKIKYAEASRNYNDFDKFKKIRALNDECKSSYDEYIKSTDKLVFLRAISEIIYWIAKIEGARQIKIHKEFLSSWAQWHEYLEKKNKNKRKGEQIKEKLRIIMGNKVDDYEQIHSKYIDNVEWFKNGKKNLFVNIDQEIDLKSAEPSSLLFLPERWLGENADFRVVEEHAECVILENKKYTLKEYYELIKNTIDSHWLKSKDLLKQIITIYLTKRCQNGDDEAFNILFGLYIDKAKKVASLYIKKRGQLVNPHDIEGRETSILTTLLKGDDPSVLYRILDQNRSDKKDIDLLNKKPHLALNESYKSMFMMINNQYTYLNKLLQDLEKNTKDFRNRSKKAKKIQTKKEYFEKTFSFSQYILTRINFAPTLFEIFSPLGFLEISQSYNKYLFRAAPNRNLTTWLFGDKNRVFRGMVWDTLCNLFDKRISRKNESEFSEDELDASKDMAGNESF